MEESVPLQFEPRISFLKIELDLRFAEPRAQWRKGVKDERFWRLVPQNDMNLSAPLQFGRDQLYAQTFVGHKHTDGVGFPRARMNCHHQITRLIGGGHDLNQSTCNLRNMLLEKLPDLLVRPVGRGYKIDHTTQSGEKGSNRCAIDGLEILSSSESQAMFSAEIISRQPLGNRIDSPPLLRILK